LHAEIRKASKTFEFHSAFSSPDMVANGKKIRKWKNSRRRFYEYEY